MRLLDGWQAGKTLLMSANDPKGTSSDARFGFPDLHSFKDFVVYVQTYLPNRFPPRQAAPNEPWSMELAFEGLREGLKMARAEKGSKPVFEKCEKLVNEAYDEYRGGREREGFFKLEEVNRLLKSVPSW